MSAEGKHVLFVVAPDRFRDEELFIPKEMMEKAGVITHVTAPKVFPAKGMNGGQAMPDVELRSVNAENYDAIVFIGGSGAEVYFDNSLAHKIAKDAVTQNRLLCAICIAPGILAKAGVLEGKKATVFFGEKYEKLLREGGATNTKQRVEVDGRLITANGPMASKEFGQAILAALA